MNYTHNSNLETYKLTPIRDNAHDVHGVTSAWRRSLAKYELGFFTENENLYFLSPFRDTIMEMIKCGFGCRLQFAARITSALMQCSGGPQKQIENARLTVICIYRTEASCWSEHTFSPNISNLLAAKFHSMKFSTNNFWQVQSMCNIQNFKMQRKRWHTKEQCFAGPRKCRCMKTVRKCYATLNNRKVQTYRIAAIERLPGYLS